LLVSVLGFLALNSALFFYSFGLIDLILVCFVLFVFVSIPFYLICLLCFAVFAYLLFLCLCFHLWFLLATRKGVDNLAQSANILETYSLLRDWLLRWCLKIGGCVGVGILIVA